MSKNSYMPDKQADQVAWAQTFASVVGGNIEGYGVPTGMMADFIAVNTALQAAWTAASNPATRTHAKVIAKDDALKSMKAMARGIVSIIQGTTGVTDVMKANAGVTVRKTTPTPKPIPTQAPVLTVAAINGRVVTLRLRQDGNKRAKPTGAALATILTAISPTRPMSMDAFQFAVNTTQTTVNVTFPASATGDTAFITAFWSNARSESGPAAVPVEVVLPAGGVIQTATPSGMRIAKAA